MRALPPVLPELAGPHKLADKFTILEDRGNPAVWQYLQSENLYAASILQPSESLRRELLNELRLSSTTSTPPATVQIGAYEYFTEYAAGQPLPLYRRRLRSSSNALETILDLNTLTLSAPELRLMALRVSADHTRIAYVLSLHPGQAPLLFVKFLGTGEIVRLAENVASMEWLEPGNLLVYLRHNQQNRAATLLCADLATPSVAQVYSSTTLFNEADPRYHLRLAQAKSGDYLFLSSESLESASIGILDGQRGCAPPRFPIPRSVGRRDELFRFGTGFLLRRIENAGNENLYRAPLDLTSERQLSLLYSVPADLVVHGIQVFENYVALLLRQHGKERLTVLSNMGIPPADFSLGEKPISVTFLANPDFQSSYVRMSLSSALTPETTLIYDAVKNTVHSREQAGMPLLNGFSPEMFEESYLQARSTDGTLIPIFLVAPRQTAHKSARPLLLYGYGAYGESTPAQFSSERLSLLKRGFSYAICHVRGGGFYGRAWHNAGKLLNKSSSISDYIACAQELIASGLTSQGKIVAQARSAGGVLVGAALNQRAELFAAAVLEVPFLDPLAVLQDKSLPLSARDIEEWGDPADAQHFSSIAAFSPYLNLRSQCYPAVLVKSAFYDQAVQYWEAAKWVAQARQLQTCKPSILLKTDFNASHAGPADQIAARQDSASTLAFIIQAAREPHA